MPSQALKTRKRFVAKTGSSFVKCEETGANVPCSMIKLHHCSEAGKAALMELVEEKNEQFLSGKWVPFDPLLAKSHVNVSHATKKKATPSRTQGTRKKQPAKRKASECDDFLKDDSSDSEEELVEDESEESEDEEAALMRAAAEVIGNEEAGIEEASPRKAESPTKKPKKTHRAAKVLATESLLEKKKEKEWVQCDGCNKWRVLPRFADAASLPDQWLCPMMADILCSSRLSCESPQEPLPAGFEDELEEEEVEEVVEEEEEAAPVDKENAVPKTHQAIATAPLSNANLLPSA